MKRFVRFFALIITSLQLGFVLLSTNLLALNRVRVLAYGDSLTAGYRLPPADAYPAQLEARMRKDGYPIDIVNGGVSGDTSAQALARIEWSLKRGPFDYVLLCIGANDGLRQLSVDNFEANLRKIIKTFKDKNIRVILVGMRMPINFPEAYRKRFDATYAKLAKEFQLAPPPFLLEGVAQNPKLNLEDTIHPNKAGYAIVAANMQKFLKTVIKP